MLISDNCIAVIPCLNEERTIAQVTREVLCHLPVVLIVDDGSQDSTARRASSAGAIVLRGNSSRGKGAALNRGFGRARDLGYDWALALDGDAQHSPKEIPRLLDCAEKIGAKMVVGNRMQNPGAMPSLRRRVNCWMSATLSSYCGTDLPDTQCGFRLVNLDSWSRFSFRAEHFEIESELLVRFVKAGLPVAFVPIESRYADEQSKIHPIRDTFRWFRWWCRIRSELAAAKNHPVPPNEINEGDPVLTAS